MKTKIIGIYSVIIGISIIGLWLMILSTTKLPEGKIELSFHLISEFVMAILCTISGLMILKKNYVIRLNLVGHSMVLYSTLNAAGHYSQRNELAMTIMLMIFFVLSTATIIHHLKDKFNKVKH